MYSKATISSNTFTDSDESSPHAHVVEDGLRDECYDKVSNVCKQQKIQMGALKICHEADSFYFKNELHIFHLMEKLDPDTFSIARLITHFAHKHHYCMAFEKLEKSVEELMTEQLSFSLNEIRPMTKQLLTTLVGLQSTGVVHSDIRPENIMLVSQMELPFRVKITNFRDATEVSKLIQGELIQPIGYRAPEVMLGLPLSEAVDMWSLACCVLRWHIGFRNVASYSEFDYMTMVVNLLGAPPDELLKNGLYTKRYFVQEESHWRMKTPQEYKEFTGEDPEIYYGREDASLEHLIKDPLLSESNILFSDKEAFFDLLSKMFAIDPKKRITPGEALLHPFITMDHLPQGRGYTKMAQQYMYVTELRIAEIPQSKYDTLEFLGEGCFGKVVKARNQITKELVALKEIKKGAFYFKKEVEMLEMIEGLDSDTFNIIKMVDHFELYGHQFIAFEMLHESVKDLMRDKRSFSLSEIRPLAQQLLTTLLGLKSIGVLHTDIKSDNIMLVNHAGQPFKIKLIDFGVAMHVDKVRKGMIMQPGAYRAPEVTLGLPLSEAVDMWSLACCFLHWFLGQGNLVSYSHFDSFSMMLDILGTPPDEMLNEGMHTKKYFVLEKSKWRLKTPEEYRESTGEDVKMYDGRESETLEDLINTVIPLSGLAVSRSNIESGDKEAFYDLLKKMFEMNPNNRITPAEALLHPFITMDHLDKDTRYTKAAHQYMRVTRTDFEPLQREGLQEIAAMCIENREAKDADRKIAPPKSNQARFGKSVAMNEAGKNTSSVNLSLKKYVGSETSYNATNAEGQEISPGKLTFWSSCTSSGVANDESVQVTELRNSHKKGQSSSSGILKYNSCSNLEAKDSSLPKEDTGNFMCKPSHVYAEVCLGEIINDPFHISGRRPTTGEPSNEELVQETMSLSQVVSVTSKVENLPKMAARSCQDASTFEGVETTTTSRSVFGRIRSSLAGLFRCWTPRPKKPSIKKPKWVRRISIFGGRSTTHGPSTE